MTVGRRILGAVAAAKTTRAVYQAMSTRDELFGASMARINHRGAEVTLAAGPAAILGSLAGTALTPGLPRHVRAATLLATSSAGACGLYDDLFGTTAAKGLRGHVKALRRGEVTSGAIKLVGIGAAGVVAGSLARAGRGGVVDAALASVVVAGSANLLNLFDLRPGRATKLLLAAGAPALVGPGETGDVLAGPVAAAISLLPDDLAERCMLGDAGANALGAAAGTAAAAGLSRR
ncbi:MAG TPA: hypothetical protein VMT27_03375, partial [Actinomycetes bacterium]|nr:hypothetical protein [Actinomycetes bacterium]